MSLVPPRYIPDTSRRATDCWRDRRVRDTPEKRRDPRCDDVTASVEREREMSDGRVHRARAPVIDSRSWRFNYRMTEVKRDSLRDTGGTSRTLRHTLIDR